MARVLTQRPCVLQWEYFLPQRCSQNNIFRECYFELLRADIPLLHFQNASQLSRWENKIWAGIANLTSALVGVACILRVIKPGL